MLLPGDDLPHPIASDDPYWRESWYLNFFDHEQELYGIAWMGIRPNVGHGELLFVLGSGTEIVYRHEQFSTPIAATIGAERVRFGALDAELIDPYRHWRLTFAEGATRVELEWSALAAPYDYEWQAEQRSWHFQHPGRVVGTVELGGDRRPFDGYGERDRAWGRRDNDHFGSQHFMTAQWADGTCWHGLQYSKDDHQLYGYQVVDGRRSLIARMEVMPVYASRGGHPLHARIVSTDRLGRTLELEQETLSVVTMGDSEDGYQHFVLSRYRRADTGRLGYGVFDHWWADLDAVSDAYLLTEPNMGRFWDFPREGTP